MTERNTNADVIVRLERLEKHVLEHKELSADDAKVFAEVLESYRGWMAMGRIGKAIVLVLAGISAAAVFFAQLKGWLK